MSIEPPDQQVGQTRWFREQDIPEQCPAVCATDRRTVARVMVYRLDMFLGMKSSKRDDEGRVRPAVIDTGFAFAFWFYIDNYGCRSSGEDVVDRPDVPIAQLHIHHLLWQSQTIEVYWGEALGGLAAQGAPKPGTVENIGAVSDELDLTARDLDE